MKEFAAYVLGVTGLGMAVLAVLFTFASNLKYIHAKMMLINLLRTNPNQAERLCQSMPGTFYVPIGAAIKAAAMCKTQDPAIVPTATVPSYDAACTFVNMHWKKLWGRGKLGAAMAIAGCALEISTASTSVFLVILAVLAVIGAAFVFVRKLEVERSLLQARAEVLPEVNQAFVSGRYVMPA